MLKQRTRRFSTLIIIFIILSGIVFPVHAATTLTIEALTWDIIGLDSNDVSSGPAEFPVGMRVCSIGGASDGDVSVDFNWDSANTYIDLRPGSLGTSGAVNIGPLAVNACHDVYFEVQVDRDANAFDTTRSYHVTASDSDETVSTPQPRELFIEHLISQNRNSTTDVLFALAGDTLVSVAAGGSMSLLVGETYDIQLKGGTATQGYEQLESFLTLTNTVFQINSVVMSFNADSSPLVSSPEDKLYLDACLWDSDSTPSPNYRSCLQSSQKAGGTATWVTYNVTILGGGGTTETLNSLLYDFSGSSYHYNADFSTEARFANIIDPTTADISKTFIPDSISSSGISTLVFTLENPNAGALAGYNFVDILPVGSGLSVINHPANTSINGCGASAGVAVSTTNTSNDTITFTDGVVPGGSPGTCSISLQVTSSTQGGPYTNTTNTLFVGSINTGNTASSNITVTAPTPPPACTPGDPVSTWDFQTSTAATGVLGGITTGQSFVDSGIPADGDPAVTPGLADLFANPDTGGVNATTQAWRGYGTWGLGVGTDLPTDGTTKLDTYFQFTLTGNLSTTPLAFNVDTYTHSSGGTSSWAANGNIRFEVYASIDGGAYTRVAYNTPLGLNKSAWYTTLGNILNPGATTTSIRVFYSGIGNSDQAYALIDNVNFTCGAQPDPPELTKSYSPDPIAVNATSTLTFTLTNTNTTDNLTGVTFEDVLPTNVVIAAVPNASTTCPAGTITAVAGTSTITLADGQITANTSCTVDVDVTGTAAGSYTNITGFISADAAGTNNTTTGSATDTLTVLDNPLIDKAFSPNPILANGISTLTFAITNPNQSNTISGVTFTDNFPAGVEVAATPNASNDCSATFAPSATDTSVTLTNGTITAGAICTVTVDVTAASTGSYVNTTNAVQHLVNGVLNGTDTATDTLVVNPPSPSIGILKQVGLSNSGPWFDYLAVSVGTPIFYQIIVENTGDVILANVAVTDPTFGGNLNNVPHNCGFSTSLPVAVAANNNHIETCVIGSINAVAGTNVNTATANATSVTAEANSATYAEASLAIVKLASPTTYTTAGDVISYQFTVTNNGAAILSGPVTIADDKATNESCPAQIGRAHV